MKFSSSFPFSSLADECAAYFGTDNGEKMANEVGNYFALATVFPSSKVWMTIWTKKNDSEKKGIKLATFGIDG